MKGKTYSWSGAGSEEEPYIIQTYEELSDFAYYANTGDDFAGVVICLGADIDLGNPQWRAIGSYHNRFEGCFDGKGFEVSAFRISSGQDDCGFFGCIGSAGVVKNLRIKAEASIAAGQSCNLGFLAGTNYGTVENCQVSGTLEIVQFQKDELCAGLLVGRNQNGARIRKCSADGVISADRCSVDDILSGLVGKNAGGAFLEECTLEGSMAGQCSMAGICGGNAGVVEQCQNRASMRMKPSAFPAYMYVFLPDYHHGTSVSDGRYQVTVSQEQQKILLQVTLTIGKESGVSKMEEIRDIVVTGNTPLYIGEGDVSSFRNVTLLDGGYIVIDGSVDLVIGRLDKATSSQEADPDEMADTQTVHAPIVEGADIIVWPALVPPSVWDDNDGIDGGMGGDGYVAGDGGNAGDGRVGSPGQDGAKAVQVNITIDDLKADLGLASLARKGEDGQDGGNGGRGGNGGKGIHLDGRGGNGGDGGNGGRGGNGADGNVIYVHCRTDNDSTVEEMPGSRQGGAPGSGGKAGRGGLAGLSAHGTAERDRALDGKAGRQGRDGQDGRPGNDGIIEIEVIVR